MAGFTGKDLNKAFSEYAHNQKWLNQIEIEIVGGENNVDPLTLLRIYEAEVSVDNNLVLAHGFCANRCIRFNRNNQLLKEVFYNGEGSISDLFKDSPYLLDILLKLCYGLMLKKLTPPSPDSETGGEQ